MLKWQEFYNCDADTALEEERPYKRDLPFILVIIQMCTELHSAVLLQTSLIWNYSCAVLKTPTRVKSTSGTWVCDDAGV